MRTRRNSSLLRVWVRAGARCSRLPAAPRAASSIRRRFSTTICSTARRSSRASASRCSPTACPARPPACRRISSRAISRRLTRPTPMRNCRRRGAARRAGKRQSRSRSPSRKPKLRPKSPTARAGSQRRAPTRINVGRELRQPARPRNRPPPAHNRRGRRRPAGAAAAPVAIGVAGAAVNRTAQDAQPSQSIWPNPPATARIIVAVAPAGSGGAFVASRRRRTGDAFAPWRRRMT